MSKPLKGLVFVEGISGSGKSTLVSILKDNYPHLCNQDISTYKFGSKWDTGLDDFSIALYNLLEMYKESLNTIQDSIENKVILYDRSFISTLVYNYPFMTCKQMTIAQSIIDLLPMPELIIYLHPREKQNHIESGTPETLHTTYTNLLKGLDTPFNLKQNGIKLLELTYDTIEESRYTPLCYLIQDTLNL